ncbi:MAG: PIN domain-containing protein [Chlorobi bacterium]|nr:PIN domain-containing protein [Chlorobiota bacterium]
MKHTYLLDTNIVMAILRGGALAERLEAQYHLRTATFRPYICVVSLGELYSMALRNRWGAQKQAALRTIEQELVVIDLHHNDVLNAYAALQHAAQQMGATLSQNDLWIAATTSAFNAHLLTTDKDFCTFSPSHFHYTWIDPKSPS